MVLWVIKGILAFQRGSVVLYATFFNEAFCCCGWSRVDTLKICCSKKQFMPKALSSMGINTLDV